jgi:exosome complex component RRP41
MSRRQDFISPEGLRQDGRRTQELRSMTANLGIIGHADGSAIFELGNTKVLATVHGPREARGQKVAHDLAIITVSFHTATFSSVSGERRKQLRMDRRQTEWATFIRETLEGIVLTSTFPRSQIDIFVEVLNADGGVLAASFNAVVLALMDAGIPMVDYLVTLSCAQIQGQPVVDLNRIEEASSNPNLTISFLPRSGTISFMALEPRLEGDRLQGLIEITRANAYKLWENLDKQVVKPYVLDMYRTLNPHNPADVTVDMDAS